MGDCASRPKDDEVKSHLKYEDKSNDKAFSPLVDIPYLKEINDTPIMTADEQDQTKLHVKKLEADLAQFESKFKELSSESPKDSVARIAIEVQKGKDIFTNTLCFQDAKVYVEINIVPLNIKFKSKRSKRVIPTWYQLFQKSTPLNQAKKIVFTVMLDVKIGAPIEFGKVEIDFDKLKNQDTLVGWFEIKSESRREGKPALMLKMQAIYDEYAFQQQNIMRCREFIPKAKQAIKLCKHKLDKVDEVIGPEGRGDIY